MKKIPFNYSIARTLPINRIVHQDGSVAKWMAVDENAHEDQKLIIRFADDCTHCTYTLDGRINVGEGQRIFMLVDAARRPLSQADIPLDRPVWIKLLPGFNVPRLVVLVERCGVTVEGHKLNFDHLFADESKQISLDGGRTWGPCSVEE